MDVNPSGLRFPVSFDLEGAGNALAVVGTQCDIDLRRGGGWRRAGVFRGNKLAAPLSFII